MSVRREDHFFNQFTQLTCSAVPVGASAASWAARVRAVLRRAQVWLKPAESCVAPTRPLTTTGSTEAITVPSPS